jgi:hypothetical protein
MKKICNFCQKEFTPKNGHGEQIYCCHNCSTKSAIKKPNKICPICGKEFHVKPFSFLSRKCCSVKCMGEYRSKHFIGVKNHSWKGGKTKKICKQCGKSFLVDHTKIVFCSTSCYGIWKSQNTIGKNNSNWHGGKSFEPYPITFNYQFKQAIRERDNYTCAICKEYGDNVHHINYVKNDTIPENCVTLCHSCHSKTNFNREYWKQYFLGVPLT